MKKQQEINGNEKGFKESFLYIFMPGGRPEYVSKIERQCLSIVTTLFFSSVARDTFFQVQRELKNRGKNTNFFHLWDKIESRELSASLKKDVA